MYLKRWGNDYTLTIYLYRMFGYVLTVLYFAVTLNKKKVKAFNRKDNYFVNKRREAISKFHEKDNRLFNEKFLKNDRYDFKGVFLPKVENVYLLRTVYDDVLKIYTEYDDNYDYKFVDELEKTLPEGEGSYCYTGPNGESILVNKGDVVIDAGAWIGDFSAYASKKGAHAYAFEASSANVKELQKTVEYNKGNGGSITIVPLGLGDTKGTLEFYENEERDNTGGNSFGITSGNGTTTAEMTTLDAWVKENNISKVDFIKADIEGYERNLLRGAQEVLRTLKPTLSICTYHLPDDPEVLENIILTANPEYTVIQRKMKLFAYVKK